MHATAAIRSVSEGTELPTRACPWREVARGMLAEKHDRQPISKHLQREFLLQEHKPG
jgi:hypothetical protein